MEDNEDPNLWVTINGFNFTQGFEGNGTPLNRSQLNFLTTLIRSYSGRTKQNDLEAGIRLNFLAIQFKDIPKYLNYLKGMHNVILRYRLEIGI